MADAGTFVTVFPEFADTNPAVLNFWLTQAQSQLAINRLGANADLAVYLFVGHNLVLNRQDFEDAREGDIPGDTLGPIASKSAGGLSVTYDTAGIVTTGAGAYNATSYGQRLWKLLQGASLGGILAPGPPSPSEITRMRLFGRGRLF